MMLGKLKGLAVPPWVQIAVPLAIVVFIFGGGMWLMRKIDAGQIEGLKRERDALKYAVESRNSTITALKENAEVVHLELTANREAMLKAQADLADALSRPPRTIIRWRETAASVPDHISSDAPCEQQVGQGLDILKRALAEREGS